MTELNQNKVYALGNMLIYYDVEPEYGEEGWFIIFDYTMSYKNEPMPFTSLDQSMRIVFLENCIELPTEPTKPIDKEFDNLD